MARLIEGSRDPQRLAREALEAAVKASKAKHKAKAWKNISKAEQDELIEAALKQLGLLDAAGIVED